MLSAAVLVVLLTTTCRSANDSALYTTSTYGGTNGRDYSLVSSVSDDAYVTQLCLQPGGVTFNQQLQQWDYNISFIRLRFSDGSLQYVSSDQPGVGSLDCTFTLQPSECLTSVRVWYDSQVHGLELATSSNFGGFVHGSATGNLHVETAPISSCLKGVFGQLDDYINSIGFTFAVGIGPYATATETPTTTPSPTYQWYESPSYGGTGGALHSLMSNVSDNAYVTQICVKTGFFCVETFGCSTQSVGGIRLRFSDGSTQETQGTKAINSDYLCTPTVTADNCFTSVLVTYGPAASFGSSPLVNALQFTTSDAVQSWRFGQTTGFDASNTAVVAQDGYCLSGANVRTGDAMDAISFIFTDGLVSFVPANKSAVPPATPSPTFAWYASAMHGGNSVAHSLTPNASDCAYVTQICVAWTSGCGSGCSVVRAIRLLFSDGSVREGKGFAANGEYQCTDVVHGNNCFTSVELYEQLWVHALQFTTSDAVQSRAFGIINGTLYPIVAKDGYCLKGAEVRTSDDIDSISFTFAAGLPLLKSTFSPTPSPTAVTLTISCGQTVTGYISSGTQFDYAFVPSPVTQMTFDTCNSTDLVDTVVEIFQSGFPDYLAFNDAYSCSGYSFFSSVTWSYSASNDSNAIEAFSVRVRGFTSSTTGNYALTMQCSDIQFTPDPLPTPIPTPIPTPMPSLAAVTTTTTSTEHRITCGQTVSGFISSGVHVDYFFVPTTTQTFDTCNTSPLSPLDTYLEIYRSDSSVPVAHNDDGTCEDAEYTTLSSVAWPYDSLSLPLPSNTTFFVRVRGYTSTSSSTGSYSLTMQCTGAPFPTSETTAIASTDPSTTTTTTTTAKSTSTRAGKGYGCNFVENPSINASDGAWQSTTGGASIDVCEKGDGYLISESDSGKYVCRDGVVKYDVFSAVRNCSGVASYTLDVDSSDFECGAARSCPGAQLSMSVPVNSTHDQPLCDETTGAMWTSTANLLVDICLQDGAGSGNYTMCSCSPDTLHCAKYHTADCSGTPVMEKSFVKGCDPELGWTFDWQCPVTMVSATDVSTSTSVVVTVVVIVVFCCIFCVLVGYITVRNKCRAAMGRRFFKLDEEVSKGIVMVVTGNDGT